MQTLHYLLHLDLLSWVEWPYQQQWDMLGELCDFFVCMSPHWTPLSHLPTHLILGTLTTCKMAELQQQCGTLAFQQAMAGSAAV